MNEAPAVEDDMVTDNFDFGSEPDFDVICNIVSVLLVEYDCPTKVEEFEKCDEQGMAKHMSFYYYVMNNGFIEEHNVFFESLDKGRNSGLKHLFIRLKTKNTGINKLLINGGATINLMPHLLLKKIGKHDIDSRPHNMVLSNYKGKIIHTLG